jgi:flagellar hook-associated protein 1
VSFYGINMATRALQAHQRALETVGQNIANAETPGYSRQVAVTRSVSGTGAMMFDRSGNPIAPGGGVDVVTIQRAHASWLDRSASGFEARSGQAGVDAAFSRQVEDLLAEPGDGGLQATLDRFLAGWGDLATRANDPAARQSVVRLGEDAALRFRELTQGLSDISSAVADRATDNVASLNQLARQVADLNNAITRAQGAGAQPNELLDQRDMLLEEMSRRGGVQVTGQTGGEVVVTLNGALLVQGDFADQIQVGPGFNLTLASDGDPVTVTNGELGAELDWINNRIPDYLSRMETTRDTFAAAVNALHQSGTDLDGAAGEAFFETDVQGNLVVNPNLQDPRKVVSGNGAAGDGSIAREIARLGTAGSSGIPGYRLLVGDIAAHASDSERVVDQAAASLNQVKALQSAESGVNLDEELSNMVTLQHSYSAAARMLTAFDEMLDTIINRFG